MKELLDEAKALLEEWLVNYDEVEVQVLANLEAKLLALFKVTEKLFSDSVRITVTSVAGHKIIKTGFPITLIPSGVTLNYVHIYVFSQVTENTNAAANKVDGAQNIQIQKAIGGFWTNCVAILDDALRVPATTRDMGRLLGVPVDCKSEVDGNGSYDIRWTNAKMDVNSLNLDDVFFLVEIGFH